MSTALIPTPIPASARRRSVLTAIAVGARRPNDILAACGYPESVVRFELPALISAGHVSRTAFGRCQLTDAGRHYLIELVRAAEPPARAGEELDPSSATVEQLWQHQVARNILPGSSLSAPEHRLGVDEYLLQLKPGRQTVNDARSLRDRIAGGLERPIEQVIIEPHPSQIQSRGRLLLVGDDSPLYRPLEHPGTAAFNPVTGELTIGVYADHEPATWQLWTETGTVHSLVSGGDASGVTTVLHGVLAALAGSDLIDARAIDLAGVSGLAAAGQPTAVTRDDAIDLLTDTWKIVNDRAVGSGPACPPSPQRKLLLLVLADLHLLMADRHLAELIQRVQWCSRKTGVAIVAEAKYLTLQNFGDQADLRAELTNGNLAMLRSTRDRTSALAQRLHVDSSTLPERWPSGVSTVGVGYTNRRAAPFRAFNLPMTW